MTQLREKPRCRLCSERAELCPACGIPYCPTHSGEHLCDPRFRGAWSGWIGSVRLAGMTAPSEGVQLCRFEVVVGDDQVAAIYAPGAKVLTAAGVTLARTTTELLADAAPERHELASVLARLLCRPGLAAAGALVRCTRRGIGAHIAAYGVLARVTGEHTLALARSWSVL
jgi:hypothetical protein